VAYGTNAALDTLAALNNTLVATIGEDTVWQQIQAALDAHNAITQEMLGDFVERSTDQLRRYGGTDSMAFDELDEFGRADAQKITAGATVGFPLRRYGIAVQNTRAYMLNATVGEITAQATAAMDGDVKAIQREIKRAIFNSVNVTFLDRLVANLSLPVKRFANADSQPIPLGPNGESFTASSHTHYLFTAGVALAAADVTALILAVAEHYAIGQVEVYINAAQETAMRGLTGFTPITPDFVTPATSAAAIVGTYNTQNIGDRQIGFFGGNYARVYVKPWIPAGYLFAWVRGGPTPLVMRERRAGAGVLQLDYEDEVHPLRARGWGREFGVAVWQRVNGAVLYIDTGAAGAYVVPTIT
jgi:hypothetical protein